MARDHRTPGADVIDVIVAVDVVQVSTRSAGDETGMTANVLEGPHRAVDSAGKQFFSRGEKFFGLRIGHEANA